MSNIFFEVLRSGINTTFQDKGRFHMQHFGVAPGGCMDLKSFLIATITGLFEPLFGLLGVSLVSTFQHLLPWGLGFAAGAMLFVISHEIIPETHRRGHENYATAGFLIGLVVMMALDILLG